jgi:NADPH:quinone reductase-like Zn-dependent oxidoreductase
MNAAWYEKQGPARQVLVVGTMPDPDPGSGEVRIRVAASGINPGDVKKRQNAFGYGMPFRRVIPHSDGAGTIDRVGQGVARSRIGERVWCYGAQSYRAFGTAAEYVVVPSGQAIPLPQGFHSSRALASAFRASPHIEQFIQRDQLQGGRCWSRAAPAQLACARSVWRDSRALGYSLPCAPMLKPG